MDWMTFTVNVVEALAWPLVAVYLALQFKDHFVAILPTLTSFKAGPLEAAFDRAVKQVQVTAREVEPPVSSAGIPGDQPAPIESSKEFRDTWQTATVRPSVAILDSWRQIEDGIVNLIADKGLFVPEKGAYSLTASLQALEAAKVLPLDAIALIYELRSLRNQVASAAGFEPTAITARGYVDSAYKVISLLRGLLSPSSIRLRVGPDGAFRE